MTVEREHRVQTKAAASVVAFAPCSGSRIALKSQDGTEMLPLAFLRKVCGAAT